jgi:hypothetical protein
MLEEHISLAEGKHHFAKQNITCRAAANITAPSGGYHCIHDTIRIRPKRHRVVREL